MISIKIRERVEERDGHSLGRTQALRPSASQVWLRPVQATSTLVASLRGRERVGSESKNVVSGERRADVEEQGTRLALFFGDECKSRRWLQRTAPVEVTVVIEHPT